ncbi:MAG: ArsR/SmtB family transcription factor, partial [Myxococcaceae bacterium]
RLDELFHALSDRTRRRMLRRLSEGPAIVRELAEPFSMSIPAVAKHLRVLERAKLVARTVDGRVHRCELSPKALKTADAWLEQYRAFWDGTLDALAEYAEKAK